MPGMPMPGGMPIGPPGPIIPGIPIGGMPIGGGPGMPIMGDIGGEDSPCEYLHRSPLLQTPRLKSPHSSLPPAPGPLKDGGGTKPEGGGEGPGGGPWMAGLKLWENLQKSPRTHSPRM